MAGRNGSPIKGFRNPAERVAWHGRRIVSLGRATTSPPMSTAQRETLSIENHGAALAQALIAGLDLPLAALRAVLESLASDLGSDPRATRVTGALAQVSRAGRTVQDLLDLASPPRLSPLECTVEEILSCACASLPPEARERVLVARGDRGQKLFVDGPLLARTLQRLLEGAVETGSGHVLVSVRRECERTLFTTVSHGRDGEPCSDWASAPAEPVRPRLLDLGLSLARRDLERMGGELKLTRTPRGEIVAVAHVPDAFPDGRG